MSEWTAKVGDEVQVNENVGMMGNRILKWTATLEDGMTFRLVDNDGIPYYINRNSVVPFTPPAPAGEDSAAETVPDDLPVAKAFTILCDELGVDEDMRDWWGLIGALRAEMAESATEASGLRAQLAAAEQERDVALKEIKFAKGELGIVLDVKPDLFTLSQLAYAAYKQDYENKTAALRYLDSCLRDDMSEDEGESVS